MGNYTDAGKSSVQKIVQVSFGIFMLSFLICSCISINFKKDLEIRDFNALSNFDGTRDTVAIPMDLREAVLNGIVLPSASQSQSGYFIMQFYVRNNSDIPQSYYYKIFYQNESYKIREWSRKNGQKHYNPLSGRNFYGSWENPADTFHHTPVIPCDDQWHVISDSFRITGNPRNEKKYFGELPQNYRLSGRALTRTLKEIRNNKEWYGKIKEKAAAAGLSLQEQLVKDAFWVISQFAHTGDVNNRWKRNPRVGTYSFLLVITEKENLQSMPVTIKHIDKTLDGQFVNPYFDLLYNKKFSRNRHCMVIKSEKALKTWAELDLGAGIYYNEISYQKYISDTSYYSGQCGNADRIFKNAHFEQYFHTIDRNIKLKNIPLAADVVGDNYSLDDYIRNAALYDSSLLIIDCVHISECPCKTVASDPQSNAIYMKNPGQSEGQLKKENVGINSRIGMTYGKHIAKIEFPDIINSENVWNGLTCAYWLKFQDDHEWNYRSECENTGYLDYNWGEGMQSRLKMTHYSEIDFEILKTSQYWPETSYKGAKVFPVDDSKSDHNIIIACTNWDLACRTPENFCVGATDFIYGKHRYVVHRWDDWYRALTIKSPVNHDSIFGHSYYYEIDWQPDRIIWRIGKEKNNMIEIGAMDNSITTIPDNQMVVVFTQEFHCADWWPLSPFKQDLVPFPRNDIVGKILEVYIE